MLIYLFIIYRILYSFKLIFTFNFFYFINASSYLVLLSSIKEPKFNMQITLLLSSY